MYYKKNFRRTYAETKNIWKINSLYNQNYIWIKKIRMTEKKTNKKYFIKKKIE
jgi:hypothetical protein